MPGEAEAKQCVERRWMLSYRELFSFFFLWFLLVFCLDQCWDQRHSDGTDKQLFFLWERRKRNPVSYFARLSTTPAMLIEFAPVIKLKWIIFLDRLVASALWKLSPSTESTVFRFLHQAASSKQSHLWLDEAVYHYFCSVSPKKPTYWFSGHISVPLKASPNMSWWGNHHACFPLTLPWNPAQLGSRCTALTWHQADSNWAWISALHCFSSLSFHLLYGCAASHWGCKCWRTGAGIFPFLLVHTEWCYDPSASAWKQIYWWIPSWGDSSRNELQMPLEDLFHCWPVCFEQWVPFSCVSPHIGFIHFFNFLLSFHFPSICLPYEASKEIITSSMPARRQGWVHQCFDHDK